MLDRRDDASTLCRVKCWFYEVVMAEPISSFNINNFEVLLPLILCFFFYRLFLVVIYVFSVIYNGKCLFLFIIYLIMYSLISLIVYLQ